MATLRMRPAVASAAIRRIVGGAVLSQDRDFDQGPHREPPPGRSRTVGVPPVTRRRSHVRRIGQPPTGYRRILVPLDGSDLAESALGHLDVLARPTSEIVLLRAVVSAKHLVAHAQDDPPPGLIESSEVVEDARRQAQSYLENVATPLRERGLQVSSIVAVDGAARAIVQAARQLDVELVAMTSHGHGAVQNTLLGRVADAVVRESSQPVLVLRVRGNGRRNENS